MGAIAAVLFIMLGGSPVAPSPVRVAPPDFSGHWVLDPEMTEEHQRKAGLDRASIGTQSPLGKELVITQNDDRLSVTTTLGDKHVTMVYRFDGVETRNLTIGRDSPIEERSRAGWKGNALVVRTTRAFTHGTEKLPAFVRTWSVADGVLVVRAETDAGTFESYFRKTSPDEGNAGIERPI